MRAKLFPTDLQTMEWLAFPAEGFKAHACGVIHRKNTPARNGLPPGMSSLLWNIITVAGSPASSAQRHTAARSRSR